MTTIQFDFEGQNINIQANESDQFKDIISDFSQKVNVDSNELEFLPVIDPEKKVDNYLTKSHKVGGKMQIIARKKHEEDKNDGIEQSKDIICPESKKFINEITIIYNINNEKKIKIFDFYFIKDNKKKM